MSFLKNFKSQIANLNSTNFEAAALALFQWQAVHNPIYKQYLSFLGVKPQNITELHKIPFLPIEFFKTHKIISSEDNISIEQLKHHHNTDTQNYTAFEGKIFESSGTTGQIPSRHYVLDTDFYLQNSIQIFQKFYGNLVDYHILALLPSYLERETSSLVYMVQGFMVKTSPESGFYLHNFDELAHKLTELPKGNKKILLIGVTFALLDFAEQYQINNPNLIVMETGGMKGRRQEMLRQDVHYILTRAFGCKFIHSEYGMTELLSQGYSKGNGIFELPATMKVFLRNITDPFELNGNFRDGGINIIDLANVESCAFIETKDIGCFANPEKTTFKVLGRYDEAEIRGCNLLVL
jgi:hypothetical protein